MLRARCWLKATSWSTRLLAECGLALGGQRAGGAAAGLGRLKRGGEFHALGQQATEFALALRLGGVVLLGDRLQRAHPLAARLQLRLQARDTRVQPLRLAPAVAQLRVALRHRGAQGSDLLPQAGVNRRALREFRVLGFWAIAIVNDK